MENDERTPISCTRRATLAESEAEGSAPKGPGPLC